MPYASLAAPLQRLAQDARDVHGLNVHSLFYHNLAFFAILPQEPDFSHKQAERSKMVIVHPIPVPVIVPVAFLFF
jgi:hypothetical protein